jgi:predicted nucleic acid-binding protein
VPIYADSSFLVSLYTPDANSTQALEEFRNAGPPFLMTPFGEFEFANALELRVFRKELEPREADAYLQAFATDIRAGLFLRQPVPVTAYDEAVLLTRRYTRHSGVRSLDILHVAIALVLNAEVFLTFDRGQKRMARSAGLKVRP